MSIRSNDLIAFVAGAAIASVVTWKLMKDEYERRIDELIDIYHREDEEFDGVESEDEGDAESDSEEESHAIDEMRTAYGNIINQSKYSPSEEEVRKVSDIYIISPDQFGTVDYRTESLNYYADGVLTDQFDNVIDFVDEIIGDINPDEHFGEYEDDSVHVRNDITQCDYEILRDTRKFSEVYSVEE